MFHFAGTNTQRFDASTTTEGLEDDLKLVSKNGRGRGRLSASENKTLSEVKVVEMSGKWKGKREEVEGPVSGEEDVVVRKVVRDFNLSRSVWRRVFAHRASFSNTGSATSAKRIRDSPPK